jgi:hypothetical protein
MPPMLAAACTSFQALLSLTAPQIGLKSFRNRLPTQKRALLKPSHSSILPIHLTQLTIGLTQVAPAFIYSSKASLRCKRSLVPNCDPTGPREVAWRPAKHSRMRALQPLVRRNPPKPVADPPYSRKYLRAESPRCLKHFQE